LFFVSVAFSNGSPISSPLPLSPLLFSKRVRSRHAFSEQRLRTSVQAGLSCGLAVLNLLAFFPLSLCETSDRFRSPFLSTEKVAAPHRRLIRRPLRLDCRPDALFFDRDPAAPAAARPRPRLRIFFYRFSLLLPSPVVPGPLVRRLALLAPVQAGLVAPRFVFLYRFFNVFTHTCQAPHSLSSPCCCFDLFGLNVSFLVTKGGKSQVTSLSHRAAQPFTTRSARLSNAP